MELEGPIEPIERNPYRDPSDDVMRRTRSQVLLSVRDLRTYFHTFEGIVKAVDGISFEIESGQSLALVGETGCGKSVTAYSILRLVQPPGRTRGAIVFKGEDLLTKPEGEMRKIRGKKISMIFQEPMTSLNPVFTIGEQLSEVLIEHRGLRRQEAIQEAIESLRTVRIPDPNRIVGQYPGQLSGGTRQRVMIAMALALSPELIVCDEPTTFIDVTLQAQILKLIKELQMHLGASMLLITHNLGVVAHHCDRVAVMYAGSIVEIADMRAIFKEPKHPYVQGLLKAIPILTRKIERLESISGTVPNLLNPPAGCKFHPRCCRVMDVCKQKVPMLQAIGDGHQVACHLYDDGSGGQH